MRILVFVLAIFVLTAGIVTRAEAQNYPWCAIYSGRAGGGTNCGFTTFQQCMDTVGSAVIASQIRNTSLHPGRIHRRGCEGAIHIEYLARELAACSD